jgi:peptide/nickel transport system permease protein
VSPSDPRWPRPSVDPPAGLTPPGFLKELQPEAVAAASQMGVTGQVVAARGHAHPLLRLVIRRLLVGLVLLVVVSVLVFAATNLLPGNVASAVLGRNATPATVAHLEKQLGLDRSLFSQYFSWASGLVHGDFGKSFASGQPVVSLVGGPAGNTLVLAGVTILFLIPLSLLFGVLAGVYVGRKADTVISGGAIGLSAVPEFVIGTVLILIFGVAWGVFPPVSLVAPGASPLATPSVLVLPVATLLLAGVGYMIRMVRAGMVDVMSSPYVEMARLTGVDESRVVVRHALPNALAATVQAFALTLQWLVGGVVIIETLFAYPGLGQQLVQAVTVRDMPVIQAIVMMIAAVYIASTIVADVLVIVLVPRLRTMLR